MKSNGVVLWEGLSEIDGVTPVVLIAVGLAKGSTNAKTGAMVQTYIIRSDVEPLEAVRERTDVGICGGCVHRKQADGKRTCYVNVGQGPTSVYRAYRRGNYPRVTPEQAKVMLSGRNVRLGTYGDPAAVPVAVWAEALADVAGNTGYTHQWRSERFAALRQWTQASCETAQDVERANAKGFGTFRVVPLTEAVPAGALHCPASAERGKLATCEECQACNGRAGRNVAIYAHGATRNYYTAATRRGLPVLA